MVKKKVVKKKDLVDCNYLTEIEMLTIALAEKETELVRKDEMAQANKQEIIELKYKNAMLDLNLCSQLIKNKLESKIRAQNKNIKDMAVKRNIEGRWSYNPETREIVKED